MFRVTMHFAGKPVRDFKFEKSLVTIGRDTTCDIVVDNIGASRRHAMIEHTQDGYVLADLKSNNGTFVDGERILHHRLRDADTFLIGKYKFRFQEVGADDDAGTQAAFAETGEAETVHLDRGGLERLRLRSARQVGAQIVQIAPERDRRTVDLDGPYHLIGSDPAARVRVTGLFVPRQAGVLVRTEGGFDLVTTSRALRVNGRRLSIATLGDGDLIECGRARLRFLFA